MKFNFNTESKNKIEDKNKNKRRNDLTSCIFHLANGTDTFNFVRYKRSEERDLNLYMLSA